MLLYIGAHKRTARDDFQPAGAGDLEGPSHELGRDPLAAGGNRGLGVGDRDDAVAELVIGEGRNAVAVELEAGKGLVIANHRRHLTGGVT